MTSAPQARAIFSGTSPSTDPETRKQALNPRDKREILMAIDEYRMGMLPLVVPLTLLRFNIVKFQVDYLLGQLYFDPHPKELMLRNHV